MPLLSDYHHFDGRDWERGTIQNVLAYQNTPISGAMLLGVSGGAVFGYFTFAYQGQEPHAAILINNTFTPFDTITKRLKLPVAEKTTGRAPRAVEHLTGALEAGNPAIVWVDVYGMPYNLLGTNDADWAMLPVVVYGYDEAADQVWIADRSGAPLHVTPAELAAARGRTAKAKNRLITLGAPDERALKGAVQAGITDTITFMREGAPKGAKEHWGLLGLQHWADLMVDPKSDRGWAKLFPRGGALLNGLLTALYSIEIRTVEGAGRAQFADFLDEAAALLGNPALASAAEAYRAAVPAWIALADALLPDDVPLLQEAKMLERSARAAFLQDGMARLEERRTIKARLDAIREEARAEFPLNEGETAALFESIRAAILRVHDAEKAAVDALAGAQ